MYRFFLLCFLSVVSLGGLRGQDAHKIQQSIEEFSKDIDFKHSSIGIHVVRLSDGEELGAHNAKKSLATASVLKLLSTATALVQKGADFRYETPVSYTGELQKGILDGDIIIEGVGDPTFNSKYFANKDAVAELVEIIKDKGIKRINGDILLDESAFEGIVPNTWIWEDIANYYGATVHPLNYNDNLFELTFKTEKAGSLAKVIAISPKQELTIKSEVVASTINSDRAYVFGAPFGKERIVRGTLPQNRKSFTVKGALANPAIAFGKEVKQKLQKHGVFVKGEVRSTVGGQEKMQLGAILSPKLKDIIKETNYNSINLYAEAMLYLVEGCKTTAREDLLKALVAYWKNKDLDIEGLYLHDGSGLSHFNAANPSFFTALLRHLFKSSNGNTFKESLPISGKSGTLKYLGEGTPLSGKIYGKSGSMQQVCCYVGYLTTQSGEEVAFAVMLNNYKVANAKVRNKIAKMLLKW